MTTENATVTEFEIVDHGIDHPDYFQGCGTAYTAYAECVTGIGENFAEWHPVRFAPGNAIHPRPVFWHNGTYAEAKRAAIAEARRVGVGTVYVCS